MAASSKMALLSDAEMAMHGSKKKKMVNVPISAHSREARMMEAQKGLNPGRKLSW